MLREERKIRIHKHEQVIERLKNIGAEFNMKLEVKDTYYNAPEGSVIKVTESQLGNFLVELKKQEGKFLITQKVLLPEPELTKIQLEREYGIKTKLRKERHLYKYKEFFLDINLIPEKGEFLIVSGENVTDKIFDELCFTNPEFIEVPFSDL